MRWLVGDVQGCAREFERLVREIRFDPDGDELWCLGDLINRGPDSLEVLRLWDGIGGRAILGNHEVGALCGRDDPDGPPPALLRPLFESADADRWFARMRRFPVLVHLPAATGGPDVWIVHAGLHPGWTDLPAVAARLNRTEDGAGRLRDEDLDFAVNVRCCDADGRRVRHTGPPGECPQPCRPWDEFYNGATLVVHGHWAGRGHYRGARTMGLDSGCVYGGHLTAWCQEEDRIVQVKARRAYAPRRIG